MHLNHLNLCVPDVTEARAFFETHFGLRCLDQRGPTIAIMTDDAGFILVVSTFGGAAPSYPKGFHVGFLQDTPEQVDAIYARLQAANVASDRPPRLFHGSHTFYFTALGGILFEVSAWQGEVA